MIRLESIQKTFDNGVQALSEIDLSIERGSFVTLLGPSGCGKSTLLRIIAGLERSSGSGHARVESRRIAYVFQDAQLLPWRDVLRNVMLPLEFAAGAATGDGVAARMDRADRQREAAAALAQVGLSDALDLYPAQLSGGMKMRVSLARALVTRPEILLLDEPFAALDEVIRQQLGDLVRGLARERGLTVVFVTHSISEAARLSERAVVISRRPGRVLADRRIARAASGESLDAVAEARELYALFDKGDR